jgi:hypothetical protein
VYGGVSGVLLLVVATIALVVAPPSPPSIAEFAPTVEKTVDEAPDSQSSRFGTGEGGACAAAQTDCAGPDAVTTTTALSGGPGAPPRGEIVKARVRRCVGDPPRQTEDPQSPPCVNYFEGDNGGATSQGVTGDEIHIVLPKMTGADTMVNALVSYFARRYEFYGRTIRLSTFEQRPEYLDEPPYQQAMAAKVDEELQAFGVIGIGSDNAFYGTDGTTYYDELARRGVVSIDPSSVYRTEADLGDRHPYQWSYLPSVELAQRNFVEFACNSLVGRPPSHSGEALPATGNRVFGVVVPKIPGISFSPAIARDGLRRCGAPVEMFEVDGSYDAGGASWDDAVPRMRAAGVTTATCLCGAFEFGKLRGAAGRANWFPEFPVTGMPGQDYGEPPGAGTGTADFAMFGIGAEGKLLPLTDQPWYQALKEMAPEYAPGSFDRTVGPLIYHGLLVLASGIQAAGSRLTPESFGRGLTSGAFPNPDAGGAPFFQGRISFSRSDHSAIDDFAVLWYSRTPEGRATTSGGWCYVDRGRRYRLGAWPDGERPFFDAAPPCR